MDKCLTTIMILLVWIAVLTFSTRVIAGDTDIVTVHPRVNDSMLLNPGKGFVQYYGADNIYTKKYIGIGYSRISWAKLEPEEGKYDWRVLDDFINQFKAYGKKISFGVMSISTGYGAEYVTPKWVFDAGVKPFIIADDSSPTKTQVIAKEWDDPVFVEKLGNFIKAMGKRYDGNTNIAFIDIRSYGNWGEGHVGLLGGLDLASPEVYQKYYLQPYIDFFKKTQLIVTWGNPKYDAVYDWAITQGVGIRRDGILSEWSKDGSECLRAYGHEPAVFEYCDSYATTKNKGYWRTNLLLKYVQTGKPSYLQWDAKIFEENREFCMKLGNKIGYHFILQQATIPAKMESDKQFAIKWQWFNDGVAPVYEPCQVAIALLDETNQVVQKLWLAESVPKNWKPDACTAETVTGTFSSVPAGFYKLAVGLFLNNRDTTPAYGIGIQGRTAQGWYIVKEKVQF